MKARKWTLLALSSGVLIALGSCATDFLYFVMQGVATQIASAAVGTATGA
jgi:hypothetical protein